MTLDVNKKLQEKERRTKLFDDMLQKKLQSIQKEKRDIIIDIIYFDISLLFFSNDRLNFWWFFTHNSTHPLEVLFPLTRLIVAVNGFLL